MKYALDTNIVIRYFRNETKIFQQVNEAIYNEYKLYIPKVVDYEIRRGLAIMPVPSSKKEFLYENLLKKCIIIELSIFSWKHAIMACN